tara:strand:+ start:1123 stop:1392 length:270 start_codon:yes stop_codon:yes gene_type:complete
MEPKKKKPYTPYSEWSDERKAKQSAYSKKWREENRDKKKAIDKKWREENRERVKEYNKGRRARIKAEKEAEKNIKPSLKTSDDLIWELD